VIEVSRLRATLGKATDELRRYTSLPVGGKGLHAAVTALFAVPVETLAANEAAALEDALVAAMQRLRQREPLAVVAMQSGSGSPGLSMSRR